MNEVTFSKLCSSFFTVPDKSFIVYTGKENHRVFLVKIPVAHDVWALYRMHSNRKAVHYDFSMDSQLCFVGFVTKGGCIYVSGDLYFLYLEDAIAAPTIAGCYDMAADELQRAAVLLLKDDVRPVLTADQKHQAENLAMYSFLRGQQPAPGLSGLLLSVNGTDLVLSFLEKRRNWQRELAGAWLAEYRQDALVSVAIMEEAERLISEWNKDSSCKAQIYLSLWTAVCGVVGSVCVLCNDAADHEKFVLVKNTAFGNQYGDAYDQVPFFMMIKQDGTFHRVSGFIGKDDIQAIYDKFGGSVLWEKR